MMTNEEKVISDIQDIINYVPLSKVEETLNDALKLLKEQPQVVRCKDCNKRNISECPLHYGGHTENDTDDDWFCADGESW